MQKGTLRMAFIRRPNLRELRLVLLLFAWTARVTAVSHPCEGSHESSTNPGVPNKARVIHEYAHMHIYIYMYIHTYTHPYIESERASEREREREKLNNGTKNDMLLSLWLIAGTISMLRNSSTEFQSNKPGADVAGRANLDQESSNATPERLEWFEGSPLETPLLRVETSSLFAQTLEI